MKNKNRGILLSCIIAQAYWLGSALIMLLISCAVCVGLDDPDKAVKPICLAILYLSGMIGGFAAVKLSSDGLITSVVSSLFSAILLLLFAFLPFTESGFDTTTSVLCAFLIIPASVLGSILGRKKESGKKVISKMQKRRH